MPKNILPIAFFALFFTIGFTSLPANAMTAVEFLKLLGVLGRYSDDINRTFYPNRQPNIPPQNDPNSQPNLPQPDSQPAQPDSFPTTDRLLEQFLPRQ
jgi:hypothetical protein